MRHEVWATDLVISQIFCGIYLHRMTKKKRFKAVCKKHNFLSFSPLLHFSPIFAIAAKVKEKNVVCSLYSPFRNSDMPKYGWLCPLHWRRHVCATGPQTSSIFCEEPTYFDQCKCLERSKSSELLP